MPLEHTDLREMKKRRDIEGLVDILETGDIKECREAICMLGELRTRKAVNHLLGFLETDDVQIRSNSAWALGEIGHVKAVLPLIGLLNDPIENVRINAAWSLGRIGDKRALTVLRHAMKNGSADLRKHAREAIAKIESGGNDKWRNQEVEDISDTVDIPLIAIEVPSNMECNYISRVEDDETQTDYENMPRFSRDVLLRDTTDSLSEEEKRKIVLGLKDDSKGLVSVDVIFRYKDNVNGETKSSSVWLQLSSIITDGYYKERETGRIESRPKDLHRRNGDSIKRKARIKQSRRPKPDDLPYETGFDPIEDIDSEKEDIDVEDYPQEKVIHKKITRKEKITEPSRSGQRPPEPEETIPEVERYPAPLPVPPKPPEPKPEAKPESKTELSETKSGVRQVPFPAPQPVPPKPPEPKPQIKIPAAPPAAPKPAGIPVSGGNVDSAVRLLNDIGMSGMTNAASTVTQLSGEEAESQHSQLRTLPIEEMQDEITCLGESIVMIGVELHGKGQEGEVNGQMQMYLSSQNAIDLANELLCNTPDTAIKEFTEDIVSTLKELANIYGGQYISAISEYIGVTFSLKTPSFKTGKSSQIAEDELKNVTGKVDFVLVTNVPLGNNRTGHLIMVVDPKSFEIIIQKLM